jgi:hypothetical protein
MMPTPPTQTGARETRRNHAPPVILGIPFAGIRPDQVSRINPPKGPPIRLIW